MNEQISKSLALQTCHILSKSNGKILDILDSYIRKLYNCYQFITHKLQMGSGPQFRIWLYSNHARESHFNTVPVPSFAEIRLKMSSFFILTNTERRRTEQLKEFPSVTNLW